MTVYGAVTLVLHGPLVAAAAILLAGLLSLAEARGAGRAGPAMLQTLWDWQRLLRKTTLAPEAASALFGVAPVVCLGLMTAAALLVPSFTLGMASAPAADLLVILGLLASSRIVLALAAIDTATARGGLAALPVVRVTALAEPALAVALLVIALLTGTTNLDSAARLLQEGSSPIVPLLLSMAAIVSVMALSQTEDSAVLAEYSGWHQAAAQVALALRRVVWLSLAACLLLPFGLASPDGGVLGWPAGLLAWAAKLLLLGSLCTIAGAAIRQAGPAASAPVLGMATLLALLGALFLFAGQGVA